MMNSFKKHYLLQKNNLSNKEKSLKGDKKTKEKRKEGRRRCKKNRRRWNWNDSFV